MASGKENDKSSTADILDPAEYYFKMSKYHNRVLTVGDPATGQVERIGVVMLNLMAHSTVFRSMFEDSELADETGEKTHITDISPEVFKLMLTYVYGGQLPQMSRETAAQLVICADKYNINPLVSKASALLTPSTTDHLFPALRCVAYISLPGLEQQVTKIVQEQTDKVVKHKEFLAMDCNCLEFIAKQEKLAITELDLWRSLLAWAKGNTENPSDLRRLLGKPLKYTRLLTLTQDELVREVMASMILSPTEIVDLLSALTSKQSLTSIGLCSVREKRGLTTIVNNKNSSNQQVSVQNVPKILPYNYIFTSTFTSSGTGEFTELGDYQSSSNFSIKTSSFEIEVQSFTFKARSLQNQNYSAHYFFKCNITVYTCDAGFITQTENMQANGSVICGEDIVMPVKLNNGQYFRMKPNFLYNFVLTFSHTHPVFDTSYKKINYKGVIDTIKNTYDERKFGNPLFFTLKFNTALHVKQINFKC